MIIFFIRKDRFHMMMQMGARCTFKSANTRNKCARIQYENERARKASLAITEDVAYTRAASIMPRYNCEKWPASKIN